MCGNSHQLRKITLEFAFSQGLVNGPSHLPPSNYTRAPPSRVSSRKTGLARGCARNAPPDGSHGKTGSAHAAEAPRGPCAGPLLKNDPTESTSLPGSQEDWALPHLWSCLEAPPICIQILTTTCSSFQSLCPDSGRASPAQLHGDPGQPAFIPSPCYGAGGGNGGNIANKGEKRPTRGEGRSLPGRPRVSLKSLAQPDSPSEDLAPATSPASSVSPAPWASSRPRGSRSSLPTHRLLLGSAPALLLTGQRPLCPCACPVRRLLLLLRAFPGGGHPASRPGL